MAQNTGIEWTDATWNPIRGCSRVSEGCRNCYAEKVAHRFSGPGQPYEGLVQVGVAARGHIVDTYRNLPKWNGKIKFVEERLLDPLKWKPIFIKCEVCGVQRYQCLCEKFNHRSRRISVNSMSDLFHPNVTDEMLDRIFAVMALRPQHTFQVLTKRPERMLAYLSNTNAVANRILYAMTTVKGKHRSDLHWPCWPLPNVQLGVSVENQETADARIPLLLQTPAAVRFVSAEPLLGAVSLEELASVSGIGRYLDSLNNGGVDAGAEIPTKLDWVIVGGESGAGARPMHPDWARSLRDQCVTAAVPFFFKQWGEWSPQMQAYNCTAGRAPRSDRHNWDSDSDCCVSYRIGKKAAGALLDGREWREMPEVKHE